MKRTPLSRKTPLQARTPLRRTGRLRPVSDRRRKVNGARRRVAADHLDEPCRLHTAVCTGWAEHFHELVGRAHQGSLTDPRNLVPACDRCNGWVEDNTTSARFYGWKVHSSDTVVGVGGLVPASPSRLALDVWPLGGVL